MLSRFNESNLNNNSYAKGQIWPSRVSVWILPSRKCVHLDLKCSGLKRNLPLLIRSHWKSVAKRRYSICQGWTTLSGQQLFWCPWRTTRFLLCWWLLDFKFSDQTCIRSSTASKLCFDVKTDRRRSKVGHHIWPWKSQLESRRDVTTVKNRHLLQGCRTQGPRKQPDLIPSGSNH